MALPVSPIPSGPSAAAPAGPRFENVLQRQAASAGRAPTSVRSPDVRGPARSAPAPAPVAKVLDRVRIAQAQLDRILKLAESGRTFSPAELLAFQGQVYRSSQEIDLASRVVDKGAGGVKQVLQTQV